MAVNPEHGSMGALGQAPLVGPQWNKHWLLFDVTFPSTFLANVPNSLPPTFPSTFPPFLSLSLSLPPSLHLCFFHSCCLLFLVRFLSFYCRLTVCPVTPDRLFLSSPTVRVAPWLWTWPTGAQSLQKSGSMFCLDARQAHERRGRGKGLKARGGKGKGAKERERERKGGTERERERERTGRLQYF